MGTIHVSLSGHRRGEENRTQEKEKIRGERVLLTKNHVYESLVPFVPPLALKRRPMSFIFSSPEVGALALTIGQTSNFLSQQAQNETKFGGKG